MTFRVNQKVVCIGEPWPDLAAFPGAAINWTKLGDIYTIRSIIPIQHWTMLLFAEIDNSHLNWRGMEPGFESSWFRPVVSRKTDISIFHRILRSASHKELT